MAKPNKQWIVFIKNKKYYATSATNDFNAQQICCTILLEDPDSLVVGYPYAESGARAIYYIKSLSEEQ